MDYVFLIWAALAGYYAHTYAVWLHGRNNFWGTIGVYLIVISSLGAALYNLLT
jgi:hypothetical protein